MGFSSIYDLSLAIVKALFHGFTGSKHVSWNHVHQCTQTLSHTEGRLKWKWNQ